MKDDAPTATVPASRWRRAWRVLRGLVVGGVVLALLLLVLVYLGRNRYVAPFALETLAPTLEEAAGLQVEVDRLSGNWVNGIALEGVNVRATGEDGILRTLTFESLQATYDLRALLRGDVNGVTSLTGQGGTLHIDLARAAPAEPDAADPAAPLDLKRWLPERLPAIDLSLQARLGLAGDRSLGLGQVRLVTAPDSETIEGSPLVLDAVVEGAPLAIDAAWRPDATVEADVRLMPLALDALSTALPPSLELGGHVALDGSLVLDLQALSDLRASFSLQGTDFAYEHVRVERLSASGTFEDDVLSLRDVNADAGGNSVSHGTASLSLRDAGQTLVERLRSMRAHLDCRLTDIPSLLAIEDVEVPPHELRLTMALTDTGIDIETGSLETAGGRLTVRRGQLPLDTDGTLDVDLAANFTDLTELGVLLRDDDWGGALTGDAILRGTWDAPRGVATLHGDEVLVAGLQLGNVELEAQINESELRLASLSADGALGHVDLKGAYAFDEREIVAELSLAVLDPLLAPAGIAGPLRVDANVGGPLERIAFEASADGAALGGSARGTAELDLVRDRTRVQLAELFLDDGCCGLQLLAPTLVSVDSGGVTVQDLALAGPAGWLRVDGIHGPGLTCLDVQLVDFVPPPLLVPWVPGELSFEQTDATLHLQRDPDTLQADVTLFVERLQGFDLGPFDVELVSRLGDGWLDLHAFEARGPSDLVVSLTGRAPLAPRAGQLEQLLPDGELRFEGLIDAPELVSLPGLAGSPVRAGAARVELALGGNWTRVTGTAHVDARDVAVQALQLDGRTQIPELAPLALRASLDLADEVRVAEGVLEGPGGIRADLTGRLGQAADVRTWLAQGFGDGFGTAEVELGLQARVDELRRFLNLSPGLRNLEGAAELTVRVEGTAAAPEVNGRLELTGGALRTNSALPAIGALNADLALSDGTFTIEGVTGELGGAPFDLGGTLTLWPADERPPSIDVALRGQDLLLYRKGGVRVRANSDLTIRGPLSGPTVAGQVALKDGRYVQDFELLNTTGSRRTPQGRRGLQIFSLRDAPYSDLRFNVDVTSETPFRIDTNLTQGAVRPELRLRGTGAVPLVEGTVYIDPMRVKLPSGKLNVRAGTVVFSEANPFLPTLDVRADMRLRGYDIYVHIDGTYDEPEFDLTSSPTLPQDELLLLLLTGTPPTSAGRNDQDYQQGAQDVVLFIVRDLFATIDEGDEESWADRLEVTTGGEITRSGEQTTKGTLRLFDNVFTERDSIYVVGEKDVYDKINFGLQLLFRLP